MLASGGGDGVIKLWDVPGQKELKSIKLPASPITTVVTGVVFTPDGQQLVSIGQDRSVRVWDVKTGKQVKEMGPTPDDLYGLSISRDGNWLATSGYAGYITLWNLAGGKKAASRKLNAFGAYCIAFTPDGKSVITGHDNHHCYISTLHAP